MSRHIIFIADYFIENFHGGAEMANEELIVLLREQGHVVEKHLSMNVLPGFISANKDKDFIVANYMLLGGTCKKELYECNYVLYEHDHKYVVNRNPAAWPNYIAPSQLVINQEMYTNASAVFCQSKIHKEVLQKNIQGVNAVNLGCSLWDKNFIDQVENIKVNKTRKAAVMRSDNGIKNQKGAEEYCKNKGIEYDLVSAPTPLEFLTLLSQYEYFVFFPTVLETLSRVAIEAKMVGCKLITNKMLGVASEEWFKGDRDQILSVLRESRKKIPDTFLESLDLKKKDLSKKETASVTVILNSYRRPYNLKKQINAIRSQTVRPTQIWLWVNDHEDNRGFDYSDLDIDRIFQNDYNWKFYGRFAGALLADTDYIAIFDDDTIPGNRWFENCLSNMKVNPGIQGSAGIILHDSKYYMRHDRCGWPTQNIESTRVDLVGHAWFFKREWLQYLWREKPFTWDNGEDIQFSYLAQKYGNVQTYCPPHPPGDKSLHGSILGNELGIDDKATSTNQAVSHQQFFHERDMCVQNAIRHGWKTVRNLLL